MKQKILSNIYGIPRPSMNDVQATGEASSPQKRTSSTLEHFTFFSFSGFALQD
jgi:hypothetical protein